MQDNTDTTQLQNDAPDNRRGTGFTNLQKYLNANQNNNLDQTIGNQIQQEGQDLGRNLGYAQDYFNQRLGTPGGSSGQYGELQNDQNNINSVLAPYSQYDTPAASTQSGTNPPQPVDTGSQSPNLGGLPSSSTPIPQQPSDQQVSEFQNYMNPSPYNGITGLPNADNFMGQAQNLQSLGNQYSQSNPTGLLSRYLSNNSNQYTQGMQNFDQMLLGDSSKIRQGLNSLNSVNPNTIGNMISGDQTAVRNYRNARNKLGSDLASQLGVSTNPGYIQNLDQAVNNQVQADQTAQQKAFNDAQSYGPDQWRTFLPQYGASMGPSYGYDGTFVENQVGLPAGHTGGMKAPGTISVDDQLWGLHPQDYLSQGPLANFNTVASPQQLASLSALQKLAGLTPTQYDPSQAGSYDQTHNGLQFRTGDFNTDLQTAQNNYKTQENQIYKQLQNALAQPFPGPPQGGIAAAETLRAQPYVDQINQTRQQYGLAPVLNTFTSIPNAQNILPPPTQVI